jgi:hypothetical protein
MKEKFWDRWVMEVVPLLLKDIRGEEVVLRMLETAAGKTYKNARCKMHKEENGRRGGIEGR